MTPQPKIEQAAELMRTLAHPARLRIVIVLAQQGALKVSTLQTQLTIEQSVLSHHLIKMKDKGILSAQRKGTEVYYALNDPTLICIPTLLLNGSV